MSNDQYQFFNLEEIEKHNLENDTWIVIDEYVVDATKYLQQHPGGKGILLKNCGKDSTEKFRQFSHSKAAMLES